MTLLPPLVVAWALLTAQAAPAAKAPPSPSVDTRLIHRVDIQADHFQMDDPAEVAVWTKNVKASRAGTDLFCDSLTAHYLTGAKTRKVERIECHGNVRGIRGDTEVQGEHADFNNLTGLLVLTGKPSARSGPNRMSGDEVLFDVEKDTLTVKPATTVFESVPRAPGKGQALEQAAKPGTPVEIQSDTFFHDNLRREAIWSGRVRVKRGDTRLRCGRLSAKYAEDQQLRSMHCTQGAEVWAGTLWAKGERADYEPEKDWVLVTGNPEARQGPNHTRGSRVHLYPATKRVEVENAVTVFEVPEGKTP